MTASAVRSAPVRGGWIRARIVLDRRNGDGQVVGQHQLAGGFRRRKEADERLKDFQQLYPAARLDVTEG